VDVSGCGVRDVVEKAVGVDVSGCGVRDVVEKAVGVDVAVAQWSS
jgi:hypothetical protein